MKKLNFRPTLKITTLILSHLKNQPLFTLEQDKSKSVKIDTAGVVVYFELFWVINFYHYLKDKFKDYHPQQGWDAAPIILIIIFLNLLGLDCIDDVSYLLQDLGFVLMFRQYLKRVMTSSEWRSWCGRFNKRSNNTLPCSTVIKDFLNSCHEPDTMTGFKGTATIHKPSDRICRLLDVLHWSQTMLYNQLKLKEITLDQDATVVKTYKHKALYGYMGFKAYQPVNVYSKELDAIIHTEFRDGNVPAKMNLMEMLATSINTLPQSIETIYYRGDSASCQHDFMKAMASGTLAKDRGVVYFAVSALMNKHIKNLYAEIKETDWQIYNKKTKQEYVEVLYYEDWMSKLKPIRLIFIRTKQKSELTKLKEHHKADPNYGQLCLDLVNSDGQDIDDSFEVENSEYSIRAILSNIPDSKYENIELIKWARDRCGKSEELHAIQKEDLAAGRMPSGKFGANYAWWVCACICFNLHSMFKAIALPKELKYSRFKAIRAKIIYCAATVSTASRWFKIRIQNALKLKLITEIIKNLRLKYVVPDM